MNQAWPTTCFYKVLLGHKHPHSFTSMLSMAAFVLQLQSWVVAIETVWPSTNPFQHSCPENSMDRGAWWATIQGIAKSWTWLKGLRTHRCVCTLSFNYLLFMWVYLWVSTSLKTCPLKTVHSKWKYFICETALESVRANKAWYLI